MKLNIINKIYVCHYTKLVDRVEILKNQLDKYNLQADWVTKYDKEDIKIEDLESILPNYDKYFYTHGVIRKLRAPEISIMLKHYHIWNDMISNNIQNALILEDDALLVEDFSNKFNEQTKGIKSDYDFIWVGSCCNLHAEFKGEHLIEKNSSRCAHGYLLSLKAAKILHSNIKNNNFPVDFYFNNIIQSLNLKSYWMEPDLISQNSIFVTSIQNKL